MSRMIHSGFFFVVVAFCFFLNEIIFNEIKESK